MLVPAYDGRYLAGFNNVNPNMHGLEFRWS